MVRKIPAAKNRTSKHDSFFDTDQSPKHEPAASTVPADARSAARLERQFAVLRQEYARLCEENERLKTAASLTPYGYCELDSRGMILDANDAAVRVLRSDALPLQGIAFVSFLHERIHQKFLSFLHHAFQTDISHTIDLPIAQDLTGDEFFIRFDCRCVDRAQHRVLCCVVSRTGQEDHPPAPLQGASGTAAMEDPFRLIAEHSSDWKMWIGADGVLLWVNRGIEQLTGYTPLECYAMPDFPYPLIADPDREVVAEVMAEGLRGAEESGVEICCRRKDGQHVWGSMAYYPVFDSAGQSLGFCATVRNISERKALEEDVASAGRILEKRVRDRTALLLEKNTTLADEIATLTAALEEAQVTFPEPAVQPAIGPPPHIPNSVQKRPLRFTKKFFEQVIDALGDLVFVKNKDHRYILVNMSFVEFTGIAREEILGKLDHELFNVDEADLFLVSDNAVFEKQREFLVEELLTRRDGQQRRILVKKDIYFDESGNPFIVGVIRDVTELKNVEDGVRTALAKEKELNELKSRFVTMVSHEYKTPLTAILSSAELLELFRKTWSDEKVNLHLQKIKRAVETMTEMLSDALFLNRIETGRTQFTANTFELVSFCIMIADEVQACATHQNMIDTSSSVTHAQVCTDNKLLRYILTNILSNAVKYAFPQSSIQFETLLTEQTVTFRVRNRGMGIPPEHQSSIFEPFFRAPNTGTIQGTGLGLSIAKRCVDTLSGTITFESVPNEVTVFTVTIPIQVLEYQTGIARAVPVASLIP
jgi:PAS domain S-box-containing protein